MSFIRQSKIENRKLPDPALQLRDFWYIAAPSAALRSRPLPRTVLGEPLVLFREADGTPAALIDRCAHRNAPLSRGRVRNGCVECPYHGWKYAGDGACVEIPSLPGGAPASPVGVRSYPARESDGFVWVFMGDEPPAGAPRRFPHLRERGWTSFVMRTRFQAGAMACLENFLDCPHTVYVHQGWFRSRDTKEVRARITRASDRVEVEFFEERDAESVVSRLLFPSGRKMVHTDSFLMPATSRVDYGFGPDRHFIITSQCTPVTEGETEVYTVMTFRFGRIGPLIRLLFEPLSRKVIRQDVEILRLQSEQLRRFGGAEFTFVETDLVGPHIWKLWQRALNGKGAPLAPATGEAPPELCEERVLRF
jgi:phenylpropionate dioxygenase-like ring-hydroxylating dioxygenase large terminal subunit